MTEQERQTLEKMQDIAEIEKNIHRKEITFDTDNYVVMANNMILRSASNLSLNEMKLLRFIIMQTEKDDTELYTFEVAAKDICKLLGIKSKDMYKRLDTITTHLMQEVIRIGDDSAGRWLKFHWVDICRYDKGKITIKISDELKPFLVGLRGSFTRYRLSEIIRLNSNYAIRIYEILNGYMDENNLPYADNAVEISVSIKELRRQTNTEKKFERYSSFKQRVIDTALKEINSKAKYHVTATPYKDGKAIVGFDFLIESQAGFAVRQQADQNGQNDENYIEGQMNITDFIQ